MDTPSITIPFTKMQGAGNDFIIIDNRKEILSADKVIAMAPDLCDRRFGIGADGVIALQQAADTSLDYTMFYRNADGSDAGMCGNGARCLARYAHRCGLGEDLKFNVHEHAYRAIVQPSQNKVTVHFPMMVEVEEKRLQDGPLLLKIQAGTEHVVIRVEKERLNDSGFLVNSGRSLRHHPQFNPPGTNVNFICGIGPQSLQLQTYERGVEDLTLACGTGAIASALGWHHLRGESREGEQTFTVKTEGGILAVQFSFDAAQKNYQAIQLSGEAQFVFEGVYED